MSPAHSRDPVDELAGTLAALDDHVQLAGRESRRSENNRLTLLYLHAIMAAATAPLFAWHGHITNLSGASFRLARNLPFMPFSLALVLFLGGLVTALAVASNSPRWALFGLGMIWLWYTVLFVSFGGAVLLWIDEGSQIVPNGVPAAYAVIVYAHLSAVMVVHLVTLTRMVRQQGR